MGRIYSLLRMFSVEIFAYDNARDFATCICRAIMPSFTSCQDNIYDEQKIELASESDIFDNYLTAKHFSSFIKLEAIWAARDFELESFQLFHYRALLFYVQYVLRTSCAFWCRCILYNNVVVPSRTLAATELTYCTYRYCKSSYILLFLYCTVGYEK